MPRNEQSDSTAFQISLHTGWMFICVVWRIPLLLKTTCWKQSKTATAPTELQATNIINMISCADDMCGLAGRRTNTTWHLVCSLNTFMSAARPMPAKGNSQFCADEV